MLRREQRQTHYLALERFNHLSKSSDKLVNQLAVCAVYGVDVRHMGIRDVVKKRLLRIISVARQVTVSRVVYQYRAAL